MIATLDETRARKRAKEADEALARGEIWGALHGVPITVKDALETERLRTTCNYQPLANYVPQQYTIAVARSRLTRQRNYSLENPEAKLN